jgi:transcriptional regulator with XRE-family HTH domain
MEGQNTQMNIHEYIATRIRDLRQSYGGSGLSQDALAREVKVAPNTISRWETGAYRPAIEDLDRLARFFGVSVLTFFPSTEEPQSQEVAALLRAAGELDEADIAELRRYAEFKRAQKLYKGSPGKPGRKAKEG